MKRGIWIVAFAVACGGTTKPGPGPTPPGPAKPIPPAPINVTIPTAHGKGTVATKSFHSDALGVDKDYVIYLPGGYGEDPTARWPVVYYLNGLTGDETNWTEMGDLGGAADAINLPAIVVMPDGDDGFYANSVTPRPDYDACIKDGVGLFTTVKVPAKACVKKADYEDYIVKDLVTHIDTTYATINDRRARGIAGLSMGGYGALALAMRHTELFSAAASHSGVDALFYVGPHPYVSSDKVILEEDVTQWGKMVEPIGGWVRGIFGEDRANWEAHDPATLAQKLEPGTLALYLDCGTEDVFGLDAPASYLHDLLTARKIEHSFYIGPGRHDFDFWRERVKHSLAFFRASFLHEPVPVEESAPPRIDLGETINSEGVAPDMAQHLIEGVVQGAAVCAKKTKATGLRELAIGVTDKAELADVKFFGPAGADAFAQCLVPPPPASTDTVRYIYIAFWIGKGVGATQEIPKAADDLASLCASKTDAIRHPDVLALEHAMSTADAKTKKALLTAALKKAKIPAKKCPLATAK
ncbi:MAG TPA: alpha/beta hydrolase family protein [Kofleriaceae bacterium]|nr:alpha/beta hydrolase family protein [Kofleriaceae bacterium]